MRHSPESSLPGAGKKKLTDKPIDEKMRTNREI